MKASFQIIWTAPEIGKLQDVILYRENYNTESRVVKKD